MFFSVEKLCYYDTEYPHILFCSLLVDVVEQKECCDSWSLLYLSLLLENEEQTMCTRCVLLFDVFN